ncbi:unnamed protein product [Phytophthora fragariaefolia]|uniref:Unnamed protein product n=1 Tax=Phytophthora fragariaefolia TaxID=1490495 RepID=A0A9W7D241_9STRA|nr:unnamed protein product [Phytophthora fragariaefolia]
MWLSSNRRRESPLASLGAQCVDVRPLAEPEDAATSVGRPIPGTIEDIDDVEEEQEEQRVIEDVDEENGVEEAAEPGAEEEEIAAKLLAYDGRALVEMPSGGEVDEHHPVCYVVHFKIVQWGRGAQGMWSRIVKCIAHLSSEYGMTGRFSEIGENLEEASDFALMPVAHTLEPLECPLHPLTPGRYELRGITIAENAFVYECEVNITLQANGMMSGTSRELPFTQECPLAGLWTRSGLNYLLQYEMHGNKHTYIYFGTPFRSGLHGTWQNSELRVLESNLDARASQAERGILEFELVKAVRVWSEEYHKDYPAAFRECVKLMLLASHRDAILPNHLWSLIVSYCGYTWFCSDVQKSLAPSETKVSDSESRSRVYDGCVGGFLAEKSRIHLRIATDGSLHGEVRRKQQQAFKSDTVTSRKKRKLRVIADHPDGIVIAHVMGNAQVVPVEEAVVSPSSSAVSCDGTATAEYCCAFEVTKRLNHVDRHTLTCHLHVPVAPDATALGTWRFYSAQDESKRQIDLSSSASTASTSDANSVVGKEKVEQKVFQLQPVQWYQRQQEAEEAEREAAMLQSRPPSLLYPLRPGKYEFKGFTTYDASVTPRQRNGRRVRSVMTTVRDECLVTLRLLPDGTLRGTSREVVQPQVCPLNGRWQANRVAYVLEYRVREAVGHFRYSGAVVIEEGNANATNGRKTKVQYKSSVTGKRRETLSGKWHNVDEGHAEGYEGGRGEFKLELVRVDFTPITIIKTEKIENGGRPSDSVQQLQQEQPQTHNGDPEAGNSADTAIGLDDDDDAIHAFTTGEYELSGCATDAEGYEYAFDLKLQLRPGGKLFGQCKERIFQQTSPIFGKWSAHNIMYRQQYIVKHEVGEYVYSAEMSRDGAVVQGKWVNAEDESASAPSEHGTFALILVQSKRQWSTSSHPYYPPRFRRGVLAMLMASARTHKLPVALWTHVFAFCGETWFTTPL